MSVSETDMLSMSDEDIMNMAQPPSLEAPANTAPETVAVETLTQEEPDEETKAGAEVDSAGSEKEPEAEVETNEVEQDTSLSQSDSEFLKSGGKPKSEKKVAEDTKKPEDPVKASEGEQPEDKTKIEDPAAEQAPAVDYKAGYEKIMGSFRAGGRTIQVKSPDEAIALMQQGADYARKMQDLKPARKVLKMLENNGLLDEAKLVHLIDLDKKDPAAIAKFLKDKQIDPLDLDMSEETKYKPGNHSVSDAELSFDLVLKDVQSNEHGKETVRVIDKQWDRESQSRVFQNPSLLRHIDTQRANGVYAQITAEMDRLKLIGTIPESTPFLDGYKAVGDLLDQAGKLLIDGVPTNQMNQTAPVAAANNPVETTPAAKPRAVLETRAATPTPPASNTAAVRAAAPTRATPSKESKVDYNPLSMSDEEFEKHAGSFRL